MNLADSLGVSSITRIFPVLAFVILFENSWGEPGYHPIALGLLGILHAVALFAPGLVFDRTSLRRFWPFHLAALFLVAFAFYYRGWLLVTWICLLAGLGLGASLSSQGNLQRLAASLQVLLCLVLLFFAVVPDTLGVSGITGREDLGLVVTAAFAAWAVVHILSAVDKDRPHLEPVTCTLFFLLSCLMASSVALATVLQPHLDYLAVVLTVTLVSVSLAAAGWLLWSPTVGEGLSAVFFRHVLSLGVPFEDWMEEMNELAGSSKDDTDFWWKAMTLLLERTDVDGVSWKENGEDVVLGEQKEHVIRLPLSEHGLLLHSSSKIMPTKSFNLWLLARVAYEYRLSKGREARLTAEAAMRTVHEMGARTTHDIKNLLQAINLLCAPDRDGRERQFSDRNKEQLRSLASRLETSLAKLAGGEEQGDHGGLVGLQTWWDAALRRHAHESVGFSINQNVAKDMKIPSELFDRALENMLNNALRKSGREEGIAVSVELGQGPSLVVRDNGTPMPKDVAAKLFKAPVPSGEGMGIGLYQLATSAQGAGYRMSITANEKGNVALGLEKEG